MRFVGLQPSTHNIFRPVYGVKPLRKVHESERIAEWIFDHRQFANINVFQRADNLAAGLRKYSDGLLNRLNQNVGFRIEGGAHDELTVAQAYRGNIGLFPVNYKAELLTVRI